LPLRSDTNGGDVPDGRSHRGASKWLIQEQARFSRVGAVGRLLVPQRLEASL
jgi:hypothetical protein